MRKNLDSKWLLVIVFIFLYFILHIMFLNAPFVNLEWVYAEAASNIMTNPFSPDLSQYHSMIANPLLTSILMIPVYFIFGISEASSRLPSLFLGVILLVSVYKFANDFFSKKIAIYSSLLVLCNPMFWTYSGKAMSDVPFSAIICLSLFAFIYAMNERKKKLHVIGGIGFGFSMITKYITVIFYPLILLGILIHKKDFNFSDFFSTKKLKDILIDFLPYIILSSIIALPLIYFMISTFGTLIDPQLIELIRKGMNSPIRTLLSYILWFGLFIGLIFPLVLINLKQNVLEQFDKKHLIIFFILFILVNLFLVLVFGSIAEILGVGEMKFGGLEFIIPAYILNFSLFAVLMIGELALIDIFLWAKRGNFTEKFLGLWIIYILLALSISRPANRYVLVILPPLAVYLAVVVSKNISKIDYKKISTLLLVLNIVMFSAVGMFLSAYQAENGEVCADVVKYINQADLNDIWISFNILGNSYYLLENKSISERNKANYLALESSGINTVLKELNVTLYETLYDRKVNVMGLEIKKYSVIKVYK